jgi:hypothetical protein
MMKCVGNKRVVNNCVVNNCVGMKRSGNKWTINEMLALQREYELLELTVQQIAQKHERSVSAILSKLEKEGFIETWDTARGLNRQQNSLPCDTNTSINETKQEVTQLIDSIARRVKSKRLQSQSSSPSRPLRSRTSLLNSL